jgi:hypothetical protein
MWDSTVALSAAKRALESYTRRPVRQLTPRGADAVFQVGGQRFIVEVKSSARSASVARAVAQLQEARKRVPDAAPLLVIPFMGETGAEICQREGVNWIDLRGNATIDTAAFRIYVRGKDDVVVEPESPSSSAVNPFGPMASRVVHAMLLDPRHPRKRTQIEAVTGLDKGYVSKIVAALLVGGYIEEVKAGRARELLVSEPLVLLDAWRERYKRPTIKAYGLVAARTGAQTLQRVENVLAKASHDRAFTGLAAAARYSGFGAFRRVEVYVEGLLSDDVSSELSVGPEQRGRNVVLYGNLPSARIGRQAKDGLPLASPILTYLDVTDSGERSEEAADEMRRYVVQQWK